MDDAWALIELLRRWIAEWEAAIATLREENRVLGEENRVLREENRLLREQLEQARHSEWSQLGNNAMCTNDDGSRLRNAFQEELLAATPSSYDVDARRAQGPKCVTISTGAI